MWELCIETIKKSQNEIETTQAILRRLLSPARQDHNRFRLTPYILRDGELAKSRTKTEKAHTHTQPTPSNQNGQHDRSPTFSYGRNASSFVRLVCVYVSCKPFSTKDHQALADGSNECGQRRVDAHPRVDNFETTATRVRLLRPPRPMTYMTRRPTEPPAGSWKIFVGISNRSERFAFCSTSSPSSQSCGVL